MVNLPNHTPIYEWCMVRNGPKIGYSKDTCSKMIELCSQVLLTKLNCQHYK